MTRIISLCVFIISLYWLYAGVFQYGFWKNNTPGAGFFPVIAGLLIAIFSMNIFLKNDKEAVNLVKKQIFPVIGSILLIGFIKFFGMILSIAIFMVVWLLFIEKYTLTRAAIYGVTTTAIFYFVFKVSLKVPLPQGILGI